ncbi:MAG: AI-2E family transporter, partial [Chloroflexi bacterium]
MLGLSAPVRPERPSARIDAGPGAPEHGAMRPTSGPGEAATTSRADRQAFVALLIAALIVLWLARAVIGPFIVAAVLAYAFSPLVWAAEQRTRLPRAVVVGIGYVVAIALLSAAVYLLAGRVANELQELFAAGPDVVAGTLRRLVGTDTITIANQHIDVAALARELQSRAAGLLAEPGEAIHVAATLGEVALQALLVLIVTFYLLIDGHRFRDWTVSLLPAGEQPRTVAIIDRIHDVLGKWLRGQIFLVALVATVV